MPLKEEMVEIRPQMFNKVTTYEPDIERGPKARRADEMKRAFVTCSAGDRYDADEVSMDRMTRVLAVVTEVEDIDWKLANNQWVVIQRAKLEEVLRLAIENMKAIWVRY